MTHGPHRIAAAFLLALACLGPPPPARAGGGLFGIDHEWGLDQRGIWARKYQLGLEYAVIATDVGGALWLGNDDRLGHTLWQCADSGLLASVAANLLKIALHRARPNQGGNPDAWFKGAAARASRAARSRCRRASSRR